MAPMSIEGKNMTLNDFKEAVSKMAAPTTSNGVYCIYIYIYRERERYAHFYTAYTFTLFHPPRRKKVVPEPTCTSVFFGWVC